MRRRRWRKGIRGPDPSFLWTLAVKAAKCPLEFGDWMVSAERVGGSYRIRAFRWGGACLDALVSRSMVMYLQPSEGAKELESQLLSEIPLQLQAHMLLSRGASRLADDRNARNPGVYLFAGERLSSFQGR